MLIKELQDKNKCMMQKDREVNNYIIFKYEKKMIELTTQNNNNDLIFYKNKVVLFIYKLDKPIAKGNLRFKKQISNFYHFNMLHLLSLVFISHIVIIRQNKKNSLFLYSHST